MKSNGSVEHAPGSWSFGLCMVLPPPYLPERFSTACFPLLGTSGLAKHPHTCFHPAITGAFRSSRGLTVNMGRVGLGSTGPRGILRKGERVACPVQAGSTEMGSLGVRPCLLAIQALVCPGTGVTIHLGATYLLWVTVGRIGTWEEAIPRSWPGHGASVQQLVGWGSPEGDGLWGCTGPLSTCERLYLTLHVSPCPREHDFKDQGKKHRNE